MPSVSHVLDNIKFPIGDEDGLRELEAGFNSLSGGKFLGNVSVGDGIVFKIKKPTSNEVGKDVHSFFTRKGFYAFGMQGFCDSKAKFVSISMKCCSSTHDSTAYIVSDMANAIRQKMLPSWAYIVLDEAYVNTPQELSPYRGRNLSTYQDSFNYHLSLHRQCIERAFGLLVGRWGIF